MPVNKSPLPDSGPELWHPPTNCASVLYDVYDTILGNYVLGFIGSYEDDIK